MLDRYYSFNSFIQAWIYDINNEEYHLDHNAAAISLRSSRARQVIRYHIFVSNAKVVSSSRYFRHVIHCKGCRAVVKTVEAWKNTLFVIAAALTALAILAYSRQWKVILLVSAAASLGGAYVCSTVVAMNTTNFIRTHRRFWVEDDDYQVILKLFQCAVVLRFYTTMLGRFFCICVAVWRRPSKCITCILTELYGQLECRLQLNILTCNVEE